MLVQYQAQTLFKDLVKCSEFDACCVSYFILCAIENVTQGCTYYLQIYIRTDKYFVVVSGPYG
jgi:hypothetical protein